MSAAPFFPHGIITEFYAGWFTEHLNALGEPPIHSMGRNVTAYRFLWLRTFDSPIAIRAETQNSRTVLSSKQADGEAGFETGRIVVDTWRELADAEWSQIVAMIGEIGFWNLPAENLEAVGLDGAEWVIEGIDAGRYHVCHRWSDVAAESIAKFGLLLLELSGISVDEIY